jgi:two-component system heavy metal sensor histidine kinase CusS
LALIGLYIVHFTLKSIRNVETYVTQTDASNLDSPLPISPPYREFQSFIDVFAKLKNRLKESFDLTQSFTSNVAHELKTPLAILRAQASQGLQDAPLNSQSQTQFTLISEQIERVISITDKLFLLAQIDSERLILNRTKLNLSQMIVDIFKDSEHLREDVSFHMDIQPQVIWSCDVALIQVLVHNLFTNAIKYTNSSGRIECQLHCNAQSLCLKVINTCPSSPESWTPRAFERFYRHHHEHMTSTEGLGLGLSICQQIAKIHQGNIWIESPSPNEVCVVFKAVFLRT